MTGAPTKIKPKPTYCTKRVREVASVTVRFTRRPVIREGEGTSGERTVGAEVVTSGMSSNWVAGIRSDRLGDAVIAQTAKAIAKGATR